MTSLGVPGLVAVQLKVATSWRTRMASAIGPLPLFAAMSSSIAAPDADAMPAGFGFT